MDLIGDIKLLYLIITFKQDIPQLPPCSFFFFFAFTFQSISTSPLCAFSYGYSYRRFKIKPSNIFFRLHNLVCLSGSLPPPVCPPRRLIGPLYRSCLPDLCCLSRLPAIDNKICSWPSILLRSRYCQWPLQGHNSLPPTAFVQDTTLSE
jgi:hypothetical protein